MHTHSLTPVLLFSCSFSDSLSLPQCALTVLSQSHCALRLKQDKNYFDSWGGMTRLCHRAESLLIGLPPKEGAFERHWAEGQICGKLHSIRESATAAEWHLRMSRPNSNLGRPNSSDLNSPSFAGDMDISINHCAHVLQLVEEMNADLMDKMQDALLETLTNLEKLGEREEKKGEKGFSIEKYYRNRVFEILDGASLHATQVASILSAVKQKAEQEAEHLQLQVCFALLALSAQQSTVSLCSGCLSTLSLAYRGLTVISLCSHSPPH